MVQSLLAEQGLAMVRLQKIKQVDSALNGCSECLLVLDLETPGVDNDRLRRWKRSCSHVSIIGLSTKTYHPELKESLRSHLLAVAAKPLNAEEFSCCLRGVVDLAHARHGGGNSFQLANAAKIPGPKANVNLGP